MKYILLLLLLPVSIDACCKHRKKQEKQSQTTVAVQSPSPLQRGVSQDNIMHHMVHVNGLEELVEALNNSPMIQAVKQETESVKKAAEAQLVSFAAQEAVIALDGYILPTKAK